MLLMVGMVTVASWRVRDDQSRHESLERSARTVAALEQAHASFFEEIAIIGTLVWARDPAFATLYVSAAEELEQDLSLAQREALAAGDTRASTTLDFLTQRIALLDQQLGPIVPALLASDPDEAIDIALAGMGPAQSEVYLIRGVLERLVTEEQKEFAAKRAAADHSADVTLTLFIAYGLVALVGGTTAMAMLILSVVRPLALLQASARAVTLGNLQTRAKVSGPEEVASLAQDFNEMVSARRLVEEALRQRTQVLAEQAKELNCLYRLSDLAQKRDLSLPQVLQATTELLPSAWQHPEAACARIIFEGQVFTTDNFRETRWRLASDIVVHGQTRGTVEVRYLDEKPEREEGPFLDAERRLINAVAERLGHIIERKLAEDALRRSERELAIRNSVANIFLTVPDEQMYGEVLRVILETMESEHGIFGYIDDDGALLSPCLTTDVWEQCQMPGKDIVFPREVWGGIWGRALTEKKTLCSNRPAQVPEGHIAIRRVLAVPIVHHAEAIGLLMVANRATDYGEDDQELLEAIAHAIGPILSARLERDRNERERKRAEEALWEQARRDPLTGVLNHGAIVEELRNLLSGHHDSDSHAVAMVDVDGLKAVNDTYGHQVGDAVLKAVADALSRDGALVGRYGGDEFVVVLRGADRAAAERYRQEVLSLLPTAALHDPESGATVPVAVSLGLALYPTQAHEVEELVRLADDEMYAAKRQRPLRADHLKPSPHLSRGLAAEMAARLVPLLLAPGELKDKLQLLARSLAAGAGYDGVSVTLFSLPLRAAAVATPTLVREGEEPVKAWARELDGLTDHPLRRLLERTRRPFILDDPQHDERLTEDERKLMRASGLRSALTVPITSEDEIIGALSVASKREAAFGLSHARFLTGVATGIASIVRTATLTEELKSTSGRLEEAHTGTVMLLAASAEAHDHTTGQHLQNVRAITEALAREIGYSKEEARELGLAGVLHDIGKVRVPDSLLNSTGTLADEEWELMKHHTTWGAEFLAGRPGFELAVTIARSHHERWDGGGYPDGLSGDAIPEAATIVAVADSFDAMTSDRPYRAARSVAAAVREIMACSGKQFSPRVVQALVRLHKRRMLPYSRQRAPEEQAVA
jgi:diguanylate cyclase (GGDEF)-like protein/putative nucleotidyltransferase with HDIG domain